MYKYQHLVAFCILILYSTGVKTRNAPIPIPCPEIFQYLSFGAEFIGLMTLKQLPFRTTIVDVEFAQAEPLLTNFSASLSLNQNHQTTRANLESGKPISYRIDFPNSYILPMLISIKVNGETICSSTESEHPSNTFKLQHIFETELPTTTINSDPMPRIISTRVLLTNDSVLPTEKPTTPEFPWLVGIFSQRSNSSKYECDGSLISSRTVITTAYCFATPFIDEHNLFVYLGRRIPFIDDFGDIGSVKRNISSSSAHLSEPIFDIVLLHMSTKVEFDQFIQPISLWSQSEDLTLLENQNFIVGWAFDRDRKVISTTTLLVPAEIVEATNCRRAPLMFDSLTSSHSFCIQFKRRNESCLKTGTALFLQVSNVWVLRGIRSVLRNCEYGEFIVHYDLENLTPWIRQNMLN